MPLAQSRCAAVTKSGSRCQLKAQEESSFCHVHADSRGELAPDSLSALERLHRYALLRDARKKASGLTYHHMPQRGEETGYSRRIRRNGDFLRYLGSLHPHTLQACDLDVLTLFQGKDAIRSSAIAIMQGVIGLMFGAAVGLIFTGGNPLAAALCGAVLALLGVARGVAMGPERSVEAIFQRHGDWVREGRCSHADNFDFDTVPLYDEWAVTLEGALSRLPLSYAPTHPKRMAVLHYILSLAAAPTWITKSDERRLHGFAITRPPSSLPEIAGCAALCFGLGVGAHLVGYPTLFPALIVVSCAAMVSGFLCVASYLVRVKRKRQDDLDQLFKWERERITNLATRYLSLAESRAEPIIQKTNLPLVTKAATKLRERVLVLFIAATAAGGCSFWAGLQLLG
jgi:hypothetical protein